MKIKRFTDLLFQGFVGSCLCVSPKEMVSEFNFRVDNPGQSPVHRFQCCHGEEWNGDSSGCGHSPIVQIQFHYISLCVGWFMKYGESLYCM